MSDASHQAFIASIVGTRIAGRYDVVQVLAAGGMGMVCEGIYAELDQRVAIKFMFPELATNEVLAARFSREAKLAAKVKSPHLVRVSDVGKLDTGVPFLVMELLNGRDLSSELDARGPLPIAEAVDYVLQAASGIAELHALGVVHRDLKPSNLFLADIAGIPTVKILDFGISKEMSKSSGSLTTTENLLGTPSYMSPEQIKASKDVDVRSDVWSLGVILYELLTTKIPFDTNGDSIGELFAVILMTKAIPLRQRREELPQELEDVVMKCLQPKPEDRYENLGELADALRGFARGGSLHRIEAIRRSLGHDEWLEAEKSRKDTSNRAHTATERPPTQPSEFEPMSAQIPMATPTSQKPMRAPEQASSRSLATSTRPVLSEDVHKPLSRTPIVLGIAALVIAAVAFVFVRVMHTDSASLPETEKPSVEPKAIATEPPTVTPSAEPVSSLAPLTLPARADVAAAPAASVKKSASAAHAATTSAPATRPIATQTAKPAKTDDLILDRQ